MAIVIRQATTSDGPALARLRWIWRTEGQTPPSADVDDFCGQFVAWWERRERLDAFVAALDDATVGMGFLAVVPRVPNPGALDRHQGDIQSLYVVAEQRNCGIGHLLVEALLARATALGCLRVTVHASGGAVSLYEREGFEHAHKLLLHPLDVSVNPGSSPRIPPNAGL